MSGPHGWYRISVVPAAAVASRRARSILGVARPGEGGQPVAGEQRAVPFGHVHEVILVDGEVADGGPGSARARRATRRRPGAGRPAPDRASYMPWYTTVSAGRGREQRPLGARDLARVEHGAEREQRHQSNSGWPPKIVITPSPSSCATARPFGPFAATRIGTGCTRR